MATNRTRQQRTRKPKSFLDESIIDFLLYGRKPNENTAAHEMSIDLLFDDAHMARDAWQEHREALMAEWRQKGRRGLPWAAKEFDKGETCLRTENA